MCKRAISQPHTKQMSQPFKWKIPLGFFQTQTVFYILTYTINSFNSSAHYNLLRQSHPSIRRPKLNWYWVKSRFISRCRNLQNLQVFCSVFISIRGLGLFIQERTVLVSFSYWNYSKKVSFDLTSKRNFFLIFWVSRNGFGRWRLKEKFKEMW